MITGRFTEPSAAGQGFHKIVEEDSDWITIDKIYDVYVHKESQSWKKTNKPRAKYIPSLALAK